MVLQRAEQTQRDPRLLNEQSIGILRKAVEKDTTNYSPSTRRLPRSVGGPESTPVCYIRKGKEPQIIYQRLGPDNRPIDE